MIRRITEKLAAAFILSTIFSIAASAATLSPKLQADLRLQPDTLDAGLVIVSFDTADGLKESHLQALRGLGITQGITLQNLGMVAVPATLGQVRQLAAMPGVRSVWSNDKLEYFIDQAKMLAGVTRVLNDSNLARSNGGVPVSGKGDFSVLVIDSGVDATHEDLKFGDAVIQNVQILTSTQLVDGQFTPLVFLENVPNTDQSVGHGTHCAGIIAGRGTRSGGRYAGVAPGTKVIGAGLGAGLFVLNALGAWEWAISKQFTYNIRVVSNSYGSFAPFDPNDPVNIASKMMYDRQAVVLFAGANSGPGKGTWNRYAKAPWVIGVAMGNKDGGLAPDSSRGLPREERLGNSDPLDDYDVPTITAPGDGREFPTSSKGFTADIVSVRSTSNISANGGANDTEIPAAFIPFYTQIHGTSMATPFAAGTVALMLDADPTLSPDEVRSILTETATRMPGREDWEVGAGYINAYAALDKVFNRSRSYGSFLNPQFNATLSTTGPAPEAFTIPFDPVATPGPDSVNARRFNVENGTSVLDVFVTVAAFGVTNPVGIVLTDPDGKTYSSGVGLPVLNAPTRQVLVRNPKAGPWVMEVRGARGLTTQGVSTPLIPTSGAALPGDVTGTITQKRITISPSIADIAGHENQTEIELAIINRRMDSFSDGLFRPNDTVTREDFARSLSLNTPLRQYTGARKFSDVSPELAPIAEAVTSRGSTLRDYLTENVSGVPGAMLGSQGSSFYPADPVTRLELAVAFIRALGLDAEAKAKTGATVTYQGQVVIDNSDIPFTLRGYVQLAIDRGFLEVYPASVKQTGPGQFEVMPGPRVEVLGGVTRASLAAKLNAFAQRFVAGN
ncbi:MAG TPA: S8 family serine peptidase [Pyrinomonadaceae bacterium]|nr:S8 family serine peptidase [Pyrinomonadaceae bacterium]